MSQKRQPKSVKAQVSAMLREARKLVKPKEYVTAYDMLPVITELRDKGLSWKEVHAWLHERGYTITAQSLGNAYRRRLKEKRKR